MTAALVDARWHGRPGGSGIASHGDTLAAALGLAGFTVERLAEGRRRRLPGLALARPRQVATGLWHADGLFPAAREAFALTGRFTPVRLPVAVAHWTHPLPLIVPGALNVWTLHDAIPLLMPDLASTVPHRQWRLLRAIARRADHLVTVSDHARDELIAALGLDPTRITTVTPAVAVPRVPPHPDWPRGGYFLALGRRDRRKNLPRLVAAHSASGSSLPLLIVGPAGDETATLAAANVHVLGWRPAGEVAALLGHARALLMPSLAEGFGLPVAEAVSLGVPVLTSATTATAEAAGGAALLVDPGDTAAIAAAIRSLDDEALRARLTAAGRAMAPRLQLSGYAERLARLYRTLLANQQGQR